MNKILIDECDYEKYLELVERATPKKPSETAKEYFYCPSCNNWHGVYSGIKFCHYCGQALDWSE